MHARLGLVLACCAGLVLVGWLARGERGLARAAAQAQESTARAARAPAELRASEVKNELDAPAESGREPTVEREPSRPAPDEPRRAGPVVVRVQLALASGEARSFAGWRVEAQSWIEATNETFPHERTADAAGKVEFLFPGFVHIDWLRCQPPPETGLALGFAEHHVDLDPGESLNETLELAPGGVLAARVLDLDGQPVAGAVVHAFESSDWELSLWQPGLARATSGADGRVELPPLPPGTWGLAVEPVDWLQLEPGPSAKRGRHELAADQRVEGLDLIVAPLERMTVRVLDAAGRAVAAASVELTPLELAVPGLAARASEAPDALALFLGQAEPPSASASERTWPHGVLYGSTDEQGEARVPGVAGRWTLIVAPPLGTGGAEESLSTELTLPGPDVTVRVPGALAELRGRVVDEQGRPVEQATVGLERGDDDDWSSEVNSAADGTFVLRGLPRGREYVLALWHREFLPVRTSVWVGEDVDLGARELRRAMTLCVQLVDPGGAPVPQRSLEILAQRPSAPLRMDEAAWFAENSRGGRTTNKDGRAEFRQVPPGEVELALNLPFAGAPDAQGRAQIVQRTFRTWVLSVSGEEQRLVVDLSSYVAPVTPPLPMHRGLVVDARTGEPLAGAWVCLRFPSWVQQARTGADGRFRLGGPLGAHGLVVLQPGYLPLELPEQDWPPGASEHRLALVPGPPELEVELVDLAGERLPRVDVAVTDAAGTRLIALARTGGGPFLANGQRIGTAGSLFLDALPPGRIRLGLSVGGHPLGEGEVDPGSSSGKATVRLERSLAELRRELELVEAEEDG